MTTKELLEVLAGGRSLSCAEAREAFGAIMDGACAPVEIASILTALRVRGETVDELVGAAQAMRDKIAPLGPGVVGVLDTCGTGGDRSKTFNVSTATAIVAAACGVPVAKHGNRAVSSTSGSADVLAELGVNIQAEPNVMLECLRSIGLAFFFAPRWHTAMQHAMPVRKALGFRTIFNLIGPLTNPAGAEYQLVGVGLAEWADVVAAALLRLGTKSATVVAGSDGLDEITLAGPTRAVGVRHGELCIEIWTPESFGLPSYSSENWRVESVAQSALVIRSVLDGRAGAARDLVLANTAAALWTAEKVRTLPAGVAMARDAIDRGAARDKLNQLVRRTNPAHDKGCSP
jgi:anthranilate phosphoribosyltransferase